jgi:hypothetical protein
MSRRPLPGLCPPVSELTGDAYDWISFPESDEILEGPDRTKSYHAHVLDVLDSPYDWVQFNNIVYWYTSADDSSVVSPVQRIRHYSRWADCAPRVYAWRASAMNVRWFNHNAANGIKCPRYFNTRHCQVRGEAQMRKRVAGRLGLSRGANNARCDGAPSPGAVGPGRGMDEADVLARPAGAMDGSCPALHAKLGQRMIHVTVCPPAPLAPGEVSEERVWVYPTLDRRRKAAHEHREFVYVGLKL